MIMATPAPKYEQLVDAPEQPSIRQRPNHGGVRPHGYSMATPMSLAAAAASTATPSGQQPTPFSAHQPSRGPRLFDYMPGDPTDPATLFSALGRDLKGLRDETTLAQRTQRVQTAVCRVCGLAGVQTACAVVMASTRLVEGTADAALLITAATVAASGLCGIVGALRHSRWALQAFFLTQIVVLAAIAAQCLRSQRAAAKEAVFCAERATAARHGNHETTCDQGRDRAQLSSMLVGLGVVYASMFYTDLLSELLQDALEQADNRRLLDFVWLMYQGTLVGVQRFEDRIHARFEELVRLGFLKPRWVPAPKPSLN